MEIEAKSETGNNETKSAYDVGSEITFQQHMSSNYDPEKKDEGLGKIKKKLNLKLQIPEDKRRASVQSEKDNNVVNETGKKFVS